MFADYIDDQLVNINLFPQTENDLRITLNQLYTLIEYGIADNRVIALLTLALFSQSPADESLAIRKQAITGLQFVIKGISDPITQDVAIDSLMAFQNDPDPEVRRLVTTALANVLQYRSKLSTPGAYNITTTTADNVVDAIQKLKEKTESATKYLPWLLMGGIVIGYWLFTSHANT